ncbi:efflux RND transporter periplasmic adaptor subunit [Microbacteriaceae bacterium 4G12]
MKKWMMIAAILVLAIGAGSWFVMKGKAKTPTVQTASVLVKKGKLDVKVSGSGSLQPVTTQDVKATSNNQIDSVLVSTNQEVTAGQELVTYTDGSSITAPVDGVVTSISVANGDRVTDGKVVAHITNYKDLQTTISVDELDIPQVQIGQSVAVKVSAFPDQTYTGKVTAISNEGTVSNGVSSFDVTVHIDNPTNLKVGMTTEGSILTASKDNVLYVPVEAVHTNGTEKFVLVKQAGSNNNPAGLQRVAVQTGIHNEDSVEITQGLQEGQQVQLPGVAVGNSANANNNQKGFMMRQGSGMGGFGGMQKGQGQGGRRG